MRDFELIKEKIRTINPDITDELLELLYEYILSKFCYYALKKESVNVNESSKHSSGLAREKYYIRNLTACVSENNAKTSETW